MQVTWDNEKAVGDEVPINVKGDKLKITKIVGKRRGGNLYRAKRSDGTETVFQLTKEGNIYEEHGDVHYWGDQPEDAQYKISKGYRGTVPLNETKTAKLMDARKKALRQLVIEAAKEVVNEYQNRQPHERQEMNQFKMIKDRIDQLMAMHQQGTYDESKELELVRQIKNIALEIESLHTGTKITTNEKTITQ